jgi:hypothetical protein
VAGGKELAAFKGHGGSVTCLPLSPDGKTVASASQDGTGLLWDVSKIARPVTPARALRPGDLERYWRALADPDAARAFDAITALTAAPADAVTWIKECIKPAAALEQATDPPLQGEWLRAYRAVEVLEAIGTPQARAVLRVLAAGAPAAPVITSARAALQR